MRWGLVVASLWLLLGLMTSTDAQAGHWNQDGGTPRQKRKRDGQGRRQARGGRLRPMKIRLIPGPSVPVELKEQQGGTLFLKSYKQEQHSTYNVIPGKQGHCVYGGLTMFDRAVWSPRPCVTCQCTRGQVICDQIACPKTHCHFPFTPAGECCPVCMEPELDPSLDLSGDSPVPNDTGEDVTPLTQEEIQRILWREEEEHREEEERVRKKDEERKKKRKQRKEQEEMQRKTVEERRREEEEALKLQLKKEEEEWRKQEERRREEEERRMEEEEDRRKREKAEREARERERELEEDRRKQEEILREELLAFVEEEEMHQEGEEEEKGWGKQEEERRRWEEETEREARENQREREEERREEEEKLREKLLELVEEEEEKNQELMEEEEVWLRGDVFQMPPKEPEEPELLPTPISKPPTETEELEESETEELEETEIELEETEIELEEIETELEETVEVEEEDEEREILVVDRGSLPPGCDFSDVTLTCDNAKLIYFPPLAIPELKSLILEGNDISSIPAGAFNGIPNLEWINLKKNKLTSAGIDVKAFKGLKNLRRLYLDGNHLETVPVDLPSTLQELKINENQLKIINERSFRGLSSLMILELEGNLLSEGNVAPLAFAPLIQLSYLRLGRNHFRTVPQGLPVSLLELYLENNLIEEISETVFNQTLNLNVISLRHNRLDESRIAPMAWIHHRNLESIDLSYNDLYLVPSYLPMSLVHLVLVGNKIERVPGYVFAHMDPGIEYLYLSYNKLDGEGIEPESFVGSYNSMVELCLDHNQLVSVPSGINEMTNLHFLRLNNNNIRSIPEESICDPNLSDESTLVAVRLENNYIDPKKISPSAFSCVRSSSSVVLKPQKTK